LLSELSRLRMTMTKLDEAKFRVAEAAGRLEQAEQSRSDLIDYMYYLREASDRLAEATIAVLAALTEAEHETSD